MAYKMDGGKWNNYTEPTLFIRKGNNDANKAKWIFIFTIRTLGVLLLRNSLTKNLCYSPTPTMSVPFLVLLTDSSRDSEKLVVIVRNFYI